MSARDRLPTGMTLAHLQRWLTTEAQRCQKILGGAPLPDVDGRGDDADEATAELARDVATASREKTAARLVVLRAALERLAAGEYGICVDCDHMIGGPRLRAVPEAERCVGCQERQDRDRARQVTPAAVWEEDATA